MKKIPGNNYCIDCGKKIWKNSIRCKSCSRKGYLNWNYKNGGIFHCIDCGKEISKNRTRCKSCAQKGKLNPMFGVHRFGKESPRFGKHLTKKTKIKIGKMRKGKRIGKDHPNFGKPIPHIKGKYYKNNYMRSSYEIKFAFFLDCSGVKWLYENKHFDLGNSTYTPDFYVPEWDLYVEIKGWWRHKAKKKFRLFKKLHPKINIKVLMQKELQKLGVL